MRYTIVVTMLLAFCMTQGLVIKRDPGATTSASDRFQLAKLSIQADRLAAVATKFKTSMLLSNPFEAIRMEAALEKQIEVSIKACVDLKSPLSILDAPFSLDKTKKIVTRLGKSLSTFVELKKKRAIFALQHTDWQD